MGQSRIIAYYWFDGVQGGDKSPRVARKLRVEYPGAIYHLMNRGDRREPIFMDDADRQRFLETVGEVCVKTGWQLHAWRNGCEKNRR